MKLDTREGLVGAVTGTISNLTGKVRDMNNKIMVLLFGEKKYKGGR